MERLMQSRTALLGPPGRFPDDPTKKFSASIGPGQALLAIVMIGLGIRGIVVNDFASVWQRIPIEHLAGREFFVYGCAIIEFATGLGLLLRYANRLASAVLFAYLLLWAVLLKLPAVLYAPQIEATWLGFGEIAVIASGGWVIFATHTGPLMGKRLAFAVGANGVRYARLMFAVSLPMIGLSHFIYTKETVAFIPGWLPWHVEWAYLTGAGSIAASLGVIFAVCPRLAATLEAAMLSIITLLVWLPGLVATPNDESWTPFLMSAAIACGAWAVTDSYRGVRWLTGIRSTKQALSETGTRPPGASS